MLLAFHSKAGAAPTEGIWGQGERMLPLSFSFTHTHTPTHTHTHRERERGLAALLSLCRLFRVLSSEAAHQWPDPEPIEAGPGEAGCSWSA